MSGNISGNACNVRIKAWDTANNVWKTGLTLAHFASAYVTADGVDAAFSFVTSGAGQNIFELHDGGYEIVLTGAENTGAMMSFDCTVSDTGIIVVPANWSNLPAELPIAGLGQFLAEWFGIYSSGEGQQSFINTNIVAVAGDSSIVLPYGAVPAVDSTGDDLAKVSDLAEIPAAVWGYLTSAADGLGLTTMGGWLRNILASIFGSVSVAPIVIRRLIDSGGVLTLDAGSDYLDSDGRSIQFGLPSSFTVDLTSATLSLDITQIVGGLPSASPVQSITGTLQTGSFTINGVIYTKIMDFQPTAAQTAVLTNWSPNAYLYRVRATWTAPPKTIQIIDPSPCNALW